MVEEEEPKEKLLDDLFDTLTDKKFIEEFDIAIGRGASIFDLSLSIREKDYTDGSIQDRLIDYLHDNIEGITTSYHCTTDEEKQPYILVEREDSREASKLYLMNQECDLEEPKDCPSCDNE